MHAVFNHTGAFGCVLFNFTLRSVLWVFPVTTCVPRVPGYAIKHFLPNVYTYQSVEAEVLAVLMADYFNLAQVIHNTFLHHNFYLFHARPNATRQQGQ